MTNLAMNTIGSLSSVNQWIGLINSNLVGTRKTGYKETRISLDVGEPELLGATPGTTNLPMSIPATTLRVQKTEILDYQQGAINQTGNNTDFALQGQGYFVVEDKRDGTKYITRDGTFHFDNDGYLVTAEGLNVLTTGQDYFRIPITEHFTVDNDGKNVGIPGTDSQNKLVITGPDALGDVFNPVATPTDPWARSYSTSQYGTKKLMVVQIPDSYKLHYSKYGSTKFDLGEHVPIRIDNNFSEDMSGLNLAESDVVNPFTNKVEAGASIGLGYPNKDYFKHDVANGIVRMSQEFSDHVKALITTQRVTDFNASIDFNLRAAGAIQNISSFGIFFGQQEKHQVAADIAFGNTSTVTTFTPTGSSTAAATPFTPATNSSEVKIQRISGFFAGITGNGSMSAPTNALILQGEGIDLSVPLPSGLIVDDLTAIGTPTSNYKIVVKTNANQVGVTLFQKAAGVAPWVEVTSINTVINKSIYGNGYIGVGNGVFGSGLFSKNAVDITRIHLQETNQNNYYDTTVFGGNAPYSQDPHLVGPTNVITPASGLTEPDQLQTLAQAKTVGASVYQGALEDSTANMVDTLPMLGNAQKLFSAIAKIITIANSQTDDINSLIR